MAKKSEDITEPLLSDIKNHKFAPVYLLTGEEDYYIDLISDALEANVVPEENKDFDQTIVYGLDVDMTAVIGYANRFPMMSERQLVMVKESQNLTKDWDLLEKYLEHPCETTVLVFCYRHKKMDGRSKAYQAIKRQGVVYEHDALRDYQIPMWISGYVRERGHSITQKAAILISEFLGNNLGKIANELSKVFVNLKPGETIGDEVVERYIGINKDFNAFELQNAIGKKDVVKCNRIVNYFAANPKDNPIQMLLPLLYAYIIKIMIYIQLEDKSNAASVLKVHPYFVKDYQEAAANYTLGKLALCVGYIYEADIRSKGMKNTGTVTDGELLKELIFKIIH